MITCEFCENVSTSDEVCSNCGEPLIDNPTWRDECDGQPSELTEWMDFDPDC